MNITWDQPYDNGYIVQKYTVYIRKEHVLFPEDRLFQLVYDVMAPAPGGRDYSFV